MKATETPVSDIRIIVLPRGWVLVGEYAQSGNQVQITRAMVIRRWGTKTGLGELAPGPLRSTVIDPLGTVDCAADAVLFTVRCQAKGWEKVLPS